MDLKFSFIFQFLGGFGILKYHDYVLEGGSVNYAGFDNGPANASEGLHYGSRISFSLNALVGSPCFEDMIIALQKYLVKILSLLWMHTLVANLECMSSKFDAALEAAAMTGLSVLLPTPRIRPEDKILDIFTIRELHIPISGRETVTVEMPAICSQSFRMLASSGWLSYATLQRLSKLEKDDLFLRPYIGAVAPPSLRLVSIKQ